MTPCARGCCWSPYGCAKARDCDCHWGDWLLQPKDNSNIHKHRDPTANKAIARADRARKKGRT